MTHIPQFATMPGLALYDKEMSSDSKVLLAMVLTESAPEGCHLKNAELAKRLGWSLGKVKKLLDDVVKNGHLVEEENGSRTLVVNLTATVKVELPAPKAKSGDIFDKRNIVVPEQDIAHLINLFLKANINPTISGSKQATARFFANPYNRHGCQNIIRLYGMVLAEEMIERLAGRIKEKFCPKPRSLYSMFEKWVAIENFLDDKKEKNITRIE